MRIGLSTVSMNFFTTFYYFYVDDNSLSDPDYQEGNTSSSSDDELQLDIPITFRRYRTLEDETANLATKNQSFVGDWGPVSRENQQKMISLSRI